MEHNANIPTDQMPQAVNLDNEVMVLSEADLDKVSGGRANDGIVCWWEAVPGIPYLVRVCACVNTQ